MSPAAAGATKLLLPLLAAGRRSSQAARAPTNCLFYRSYSADNTGRSAKRSLARRIVSTGIVSLAGGVALSAINDLALFHGCSSKAIEKATENREVVEAIEVPIVRGPWYDASLAVGHRWRSVSCTFPVSGPRGPGIFQFMAIWNGVTLSLKGHKPATKGVTFDIDKEDKEVCILQHSEKLAVALGSSASILFSLIRVALISKQMKRRGAVIRIVKNLRICEDCYSVMKVVSEVSDRVIVVRDRNRFHHFMNGSCSCLDYW